jgi:hypothetical protein
MRINVYSQELLCDPLPLGRPVNHSTNGASLIPELVGAGIIESFGKHADTGVVYSAVRLYLKSPDALHLDEHDDDRSAITFWLPKSQKRRVATAQSLEALAHMIRNAPPETGLD